MKYQFKRLVAAAITSSLNVILDWRVEDRIVCVCVRACMWVWVFVLRGLHLPGTSKHKVCVAAAPESAEYKSTTELFLNSSSQGNSRCHLCYCTTGLHSQQNWHAHSETVCKLIIANN